MDLENGSKDANEYIKEQDFFTPSEAAYRWKLKRNTVIAALNRGRFDQYLQDGKVRKFTLEGSTDWYISTEAMRGVFGEEDKVQAIELWNRVGDNSKSRKSICFLGRNVYVTDSGEDVPVDIFEKLRNAKSYRDARRVITEYICEKNNQDYVIRVEIIDLFDTLKVNYTDFFDAHRMNDEAHQNVVADTLNKCRLALEEGKTIQFYRISTNILSQEDIEVQMGRFSTNQELDKLEQDLADIQSMYKN